MEKAGVAGAVADFEKVFEDMDVKTGEIIEFVDDEIEKLQNALTSSLELVSKGILIDSKDNWQPIEYIFTRLNDIKPAMIEEATKKAREVAEKFAQDSNSEVGEIKKAYQGIFSISNRDQTTPHIKVIRVVTTVDYFLKD